MHLPTRHSASHVPASFLLSSSTEASLVSWRLLTPNSDSGGTRRTRLYQSCTLNDNALQTLRSRHSDVIRDHVFMKRTYRDLEAIDSLKPIIATLVSGGVNPPTLRCPLLRQPTASDAQCNRGSYLTLTDQASEVVLTSRPLLFLGLRLDAIVTQS